MTLQKLLSYLRQCIQEYDMIEENDKIAIGLSGGKDSLTLLYGIKNYNVSILFHMNWLLFMLI